MEAILRGFCQSSLNTINDNMVIMNSCVIACFAFLITVNASTIPNTKIIEGPSSKTTLTGPDGSVITSATAGGQIIIEDRLEEASKGRSVVAAAPQATAIASAPTTPAEVAATPALLAETTTIDASPSGITQFNYIAPIVSAPAAPLVAVRAAPIVTPNIVPLLPNIVIPQNSLDAVTAEPAGIVATSKAIPEPAAVFVPVVHA